MKSPATANDFERYPLAGSLPRSGLVQARLYETAIRLRALWGFERCK